MSSRSGSQRKTVMYRAKDSPDHLNRPGQYLRQLRRRSDYKNCDIVLVMEGSAREYLHSILAGAHSSKLAKFISSASLPTTIDLTQFRGDVVKEVVDWMYFGEGELKLDHLKEHLILCHYLGVNFLHRQLEQTLRTEGRRGSSTTALDTATDTKTGVSAEAVSDLISAIYERFTDLPPLGSREIVRMKPESIQAMVSSNFPQSIKIALINIALIWLRDSSNFDYCDSIISHITVNEMRSTEQRAFQRTLITALRNPNTRRVVNVSLKNGNMAINMDCGEHKSTSDLSSLVKTYETDNPMFSVMEDSNEDIPTHKNTCDHPETGALTFSRFDDFSKVSHSARNNARPAGFAPVQSYPSLIEDLSTLPPTAQVFAPKRSFQPCSPFYTLSEKQDIRDLPDVFQKPTVLRPPPSHALPIKHSGNNSFGETDTFGENEVIVSPTVLSQLKKSTNTQLPYKPDSVSKAPSSELVYSMPNVFRNHCANNGTVSYTESEVKDIRNLPNVFENSVSKAPSSELVYSMPNVFRNHCANNGTVSYTESEVKDIRNLPNVFENSCSGFSTHYDHKQPRHTDSHILEMNQIHDVTFSNNSLPKSGFLRKADSCMENEPQKKTSTTSRSPSSTQLRTFGKYDRSESEVAEMKRMDSFGNVSNEKVGPTNSEYANDYDSDGVVKSSYYSI